MAATFFFPKDLSTTYWLPAVFESADGKSESKHLNVYFENNLNLVLNECLADYKDVSYNRQSGIFLTNLTNHKKIFASKALPENTSPLTEISTPLATPKINNFSFDKIVTITNNFELSATSRASFNDIGYPTNFTAKDTFRLIFSKDTVNNIFEDVETDFVSVESTEFSKSTEGIPNNYLLTWNITSDENVYDISFKPKIYPESYSQKFSYLLSEDGICLFKPNSNFYYIVDKNDNGKYHMVSYIPQVDSIIPSSAFLRFVSYKNVKADLLRIEDSHLVEYDVNKLDTQQSLNPNLLRRSKPYKQNFIGIFPLEKPEKYDNFSRYKTQIAGLKNYQTPEYNYSFNSLFLKDYEGLQRSYEKIYTGTNQTKGLETIHLGYQSSTSEIIFQPDTESRFIFPVTAPVTPLSGSGLIQDGAIAGHHPYISDRILVKHLDYNGFLPNLPQPPGLEKTDNVWFCAWLSGTADGEKVWMDRFINAAYYTLDEALSADVLVYNNKLDPSKPYIYDVPSTMVLSPGAFYRYYHTGVETSKKYITYLDNLSSAETQTKILEISSWNTNPLQDSSGFSHNGIVFAEEFGGFNDYYWEMDGTNHAVFPARTTLLEATNFTTSLWVHCDDWSNIKGGQIFGNFYDSGYGLINESAQTAPIFSFVETTSGQIYRLNYLFKICSVKNFNIAPAASDYIIINLPNFQYWMFDVVNGFGYKYDPDGRLLATSDRVTKISQIETDDQLNLYISQVSKKYITILSSDGKIIINKKPFLNSKTNRIEIFKYKTYRYGRNSLIEIKEILGNASTIDNFGNIWQSIGGNLYKSAYNQLSDKHEEPVHFATVGKTEQITCDNYNNIWILHDEDKLSKLSVNGKFDTFRFGSRVGGEIDYCAVSPNRFRYLNFIKTPERGSVGCEYFEFKDLAILIDTRDNLIYMLDTNGDILTKLDATLLQNLKTTNIKIAADGDFTGYQHLRKFSSQVKNLSWKMRVAYPNGTSPETLNLTYDTSTLAPGWHHIALVFDASKGYVRYFIDTVEVSSRLIRENKILYFDFRSSLILGADSVKNNILNDLLGIQNAYKFVGKVADLKIYNKSLQSGDVEQLYFSFLLSDNRRPLRWNILTGPRNYIEEIKYWYQMQLPGNKSKYFNINLYNLDVSDEVKKTIEDAIRKNIDKITPAHTALYKINWL